MTEQPTTPGWYQHPEMVNTLCYWDGTAWTDKVQPMSDTTKAVDAGVKKLVGAILAIVILVVVGYFAVTASNSADCESDNTDRIIAGEPTEDC